MSRITYLLIGLCFCSGPEFKSRDFFALGADCHIKALTNQDDLMDSAITMCQIIENKFSIFDSSSNIAHLNRQGKIVDPELAMLIEKAEKISYLTGGRYDITCKPLLEIWGFYNNKYRIPDQKEIEMTRAKVNFGKIEISGDTISLNGTEVDLGSMIAGYAADKILELFKRHNIPEALIDMGGEIIAYGRKWKIGIKDPRKGGVLQVLDLEGSIATSGDYENFFIKGGIRYNHIIDCLTGYPAHEIISTTVIAKDCLTADMLSTALFIVGSDRGIRLAKELGAEAQWVDKNLNSIHTQGFP